MTATDPSEGPIGHPDPELVRSLRGKYRRWVTETTDEARRAARAEDAEHEERRGGRPC